MNGIKAEIEAAGNELVLLEKYTEKAQLLDAVKDADAMIIRSDKVDAEVLDAAKQLKIVVRAGAGYDNIDLAAATAHNVVAENTPGQNANAVAELVFGLLVMAVRGFYNGKSGSELLGKKLGILAFGNVGRNVARIAKGFGMDVYYHAIVEWHSAAHVSSFYHFTFSVNLPNDYMVVAFNDVISIDNSGRLDGQPNRFHSYQWYHNGEAIPNATSPYYQERGDLNGQYAVMVNLGTDDEAMTCPLTFQLPDKATVSLMPSPVATTTTVTLQGFNNQQHQLQVFNSYGIMVFNTSFQGEQHMLDLTTLPQGTYLITVDGHAAKTLKL